MRKTVISGQTTLFEYKHRNTALGYVLDNDIGAIRGASISFDRLSDYIGKKVLLEMPRQSATDYKIIKIIRFWKDCDNCYIQNGSKFTVHGKVSKVAYVDDKKFREYSANELYYSNGRYAGKTSYQSCMYELI